MCGIVGILSLRDTPINKIEVENFRNSLHHRGPDGQGTFISDDHKIGLGHTRLSIIDVSDNSSQPMSYDNGRYHITYNGEIYNFLDLKQELEQKGYKFKSSGDVEVILASYKYWGEKCNLKFNGMWSFAIWDSKKKELFVSRDRFGVKPLYYMSNEKLFFFASELKSFMHLEKKNRPNFDNNYLIYLSQSFSNQSYLTSKNTFLKNVFELPPGHQLKINYNKNIKVEKWWSTLDHLEKPLKKYEDQVDRFKEIFYDACRIRMISDVEISTSLSGGLDSSSIVQVIDSLKNESKNDPNISYPHNTFILDYKNEKDNEIDFAIAATKNLSLIKNIIEVDLNKVSPEDIIKTIYHLEDVSGNDGLGPWNLYKNMRKKNIRVSIEGHGADELLAGYSGYPRISMKDCKFPCDLYKWFDLFKIHLKMNEHEGKDENIFKIFLEFLGKKYKRSLKFNSSKKNNISIFNQEPGNYSSVEFDNMENFSNLDKSLYTDYHYRSSQINLRKFDRLSMANGVECRLPFYDWRLATYTFSLDSKIKINKGFSKNILRDCMKNNLDNKILKRIKKKGFNPANNLFNNTMTQFINDTLKSSDFKDLEFVDKSKVNLLLNSKNLNYKEMFKLVQITFLIKTFSKSLSV